MFWPDKGSAGAGAFFLFWIIVDLLAWIIWWIGGGAITEGTGWIKCGLGRLTERTWLKVGRCIIIGGGRFILMSLRISIGCPFIFNGECRTTTLSMLCLTIFVPDGCESTFWLVFFLPRTELEIAGTYEWNSGFWLNRCLQSITAGKKAHLMFQFI